MGKKWVALIMALVLVWGYLVSTRVLLAQDEKSKEKPVSKEPITEETKISPELQAKIKPLLKQLGDTDWQTREKASEEMEKIIEEESLEKVGPFLKEYLSSTKDPEVCMRLGKLLITPEQKFEKLNYPKQQGWITDKDKPPRKDNCRSIGYAGDQKFSILKKYRGYKYRIEPGLLDIPGKDIVDYRGNAFKSHELSSEKFSKILKDEGVKANDIKTAEKIVATYFEMIDLDVSTYAGKTPDIKELKSEETEKEYKFKVLAKTFITSDVVENGEWEFTISKKGNDFSAKKSKIIESFQIDYD